MRARSIAAWLFILLVLNLVAFDACLWAFTTGETEEAGRARPPVVGEQEGAADSLDASPEASPVPAAVPGGPAIAPPSSRDQLIFENRDGSVGKPARSHAPIYKKWWFWTVAASVAATAVVLSVGGAEESRRDLPDFPNPPER